MPLRPNKANFKRLVRVVAGRTGVGYRRLPCKYLHWRPPPGSGVGLNFGDELTAEIVKRIVGPDAPFGDETYLGPKMLTGGSTLQFAADGDIIWGVGCRNTGSYHYFKQIDVRSVRGPLTREFLLGRKVACPPLYGDPGILTPLLFPELKEQAEGTPDGFGLVPHLSEWHRYSAHPPPGFKLISPDGAPFDVITQILACRAVLSSSLHGIILAEAYGIPAVLLRRESPEPMFKYYDYYLSTQRSPLVATDLEAFEDKLPAWEPPVMPDRDRLLDAFPHAAP